MTKQERINEHQRAKRQANGNAFTRKYEKTVRGFLMRAYRNMLSRTQGLVKPHLYKGLEILTKEQFYAWALHDHAFNALYREWVREGHTNRLSPSVNRVNPTRGYTLDNIEWLSHAVNSGLFRKHKSPSQQDIQSCLERVAYNV